MPSELRIETPKMPAADIGPENPLPSLGSSRDLHVIKAPPPDIPEEMARQMAYGRVLNFLPYMLQDRYNRSREIPSFRVAVLETELLCATFLLEFGGRLWSLIHKPSERELLYATRSSSQQIWGCVTPEQ